MKIEHLRRFVVLAEELHFPRAAAQIGIPLASLYTTLDKLEEEAGQTLITRQAPTRLTPVGMLLLEDARRQVKASPTPLGKPKASAGGKAKANKGKGRAPIVKGQPKPYKKRQGR